MDTVSYQLAMLGLDWEAELAQVSLPKPDDLVDDSIEDNLPLCAMFLTLVVLGIVEHRLKRDRQVRELEPELISRGFIGSTSIPRSNLLRRQLKSTVIRRGNHADTERICTGPGSVREGIDGTRS